MNTKLLEALAQADVEVEVLAATGPVLDVFELCAAARDIQNVYETLEPKALVDLVPDTLKERISYPSVIFSSHGGARGREAGVTPFSQFLAASSLVRRFSYKSSTSTGHISGYTTSNWEFVFLCSKDPDFNTSLGQCMLLRLEAVAPLRKRPGTPPMTMKQFQTNLARFAENVPTRTGSTRASRQADARDIPVMHSGPAPSHLPDMKRMTEAELEAQHISLEALRGSKFTGLDSFRRALESAVAERYGTCLL